MPENLKNNPDSTEFDAYVHELLAKKERVNRLGSLKQLIGSVVSFYVN